MEPQDINLQLSTEEINLLLEGLGGMPFVKVYALVGKIQQQASEQFGQSALPVESASDLS
ncbi:MAG: hypothetical protein ACU83U_12540 [Gammaproteobacteria bacterium]